LEEEEKDQVRWWLGFEEEIREHHCKRGEEKRRKVKASYRPYSVLPMEKDGLRHGWRRRKLSYPATKTQSPRAYDCPSRVTEWT
jgi:hypothetical protein